MRSSFSLNNIWPMWRRGCSCKKACWGTVMAHGPGSFRQTGLFRTEAVIRHKSQLLSANPSTKRNLTYSSACYADSLRCTPCLWSNVMAHCILRPQDSHMSFCVGIAWPECVSSWGLWIDLSSLRVTSRELEVPSTGKKSNGSNPFAC